jgi:hypothetical protein
MDGGEARDGHLQLYQQARAWFQSVAGMWAFVLLIDSLREYRGRGKVWTEPKSVPQRLKPQCRGSFFGTGEPVPLSETREIRIIIVSVAAANSIPAPGAQKSFVGETACRMSRRFGRC